MQSVTEFGQVMSSRYRSDELRHYNYGDLWKKDKIIIEKTHE